MVAIGPTTRLSRSVTPAAHTSRADGLPPNPSVSLLELRAHAIEGLADHLGGGPLDQPRADPGQRAGDVHLGAPVHDRGPVRAVRELHQRVGVDGTARRLPVGLDDRLVGRDELGERHIDVEPGADEPDPDLGRGLEVGGVHDLDLLDAGAALADLLGIDDERPDLLAAGTDRD